MALASSATPTNAPPMPAARVPTAGNACAAARDGSEIAATNDARTREILVIFVSLAGNLSPEIHVLGGGIQLFVPQASGRLSTALPDKSIWLPQPLRPASRLRQ